MPTSPKKELNCCRCSRSGICRNCSCPKLAGLVQSASLVVWESVSTSTSLPPPHALLFPHLLRLPPQPLFLHVLAKPLSQIGVLSSCVGPLLCITFPRGLGMLGPVCFSKLFPTSIRNFPTQIPGADFTCSPGAS